MVKYKDKIIAYFDSCPDGVVVAANELYEKEFSKMSEAAFFKALERLAKSGIIQRVAKGMYMKSASSKGDDVLNHFLAKIMITECISGHGFIINTVFQM